MIKFEMDGIAYETDSETLEVLRQIVPSSKINKDYSAVAAIMILGLKCGRIREIGRIEEMVV